jgi:hypothetical protein
LTPDQVGSSLDAGERHLSIARVALHRAADLLETAQRDESRLEVHEALELVFLALEELDPEPPAR